MILNLFRKKLKPNKEDGFNKKPVWGIIVPHTEKKQGASNKSKGISEYMFGLSFVKLMKQPFETRDEGGVYGAACRLVKKGVTATLEPHKNAFNTNAHGFELLVMKGDKASISYAKHVVEAFKEKYPTRRIRGENGLKLVEEGDRGFNNLKACEKAGIDIRILSEEFFIDNTDDWLTPAELVRFWRSVL